MQTSTEVKKFDTEWDNIRPSFTKPDQGQRRVKDAFTSVTSQINARVGNYLKTRPHEAGIYLSPALKVSLEMNALSN